MARLLRLGDMLVGLTAVFLVLLLWAWGVTHWQARDYGAGFWAWSCSLILLWAVCHAATHYGRWPRFLIVVWLLLSWLRIYRVVDIPADSGHPMTSETSGPVLALWIMQMIDDHTYANIFTTDWGVYIAPNWIASKLVPNVIEACRYTATIWGALSIGATGLLAWQLGGGPIALVSMLLIGVSWWHNGIGRILPVLSAPFGVALAWWALIRSIDRRSVTDAILAGIAAGLALRLYASVRILLVAIPVWWIWHAWVTRGFLRRTWWCAGLAVVVTIMTMWPAIQTLGAYYFERERVIMVDGAEVKGLLFSDPVAHIGRQLRVFTGGADFLVNSPTASPLFTPTEIALIFLGLVVAATRWRDPRATVGAFWMVLTFATVAISSVPDASRRLAVAFPAFGILGATGLLWSLQWAKVIKSTVIRYSVVGVLLAALTAADLQWNWAYFNKFRAEMIRGAGRPEGPIPKPLQ